MSADFSSEDSEDSNGSSQRLSACSSTALPTTAAPVIPTAQLSPIFRLKRQTRDRIYDYCFDIEYDDYTDPVIAHYMKKMAYQVLRENYWWYHHFPEPSFRSWSHNPRGLKLLLVCKLFAREAGIRFYRFHFFNYLYYGNSFENLRDRLLLIPETYRWRLNALLRLVASKNTLDWLPVHSDAIPVIANKAGLGDNAPWVGAWGTEGKIMHYRYFVIQEFYNREPKALALGGKLGCLKWLSVRHAQIDFEAMRGDIDLSPFPVRPSAPNQRAYISVRQGTSKESTERTIEKIMRKELRLVRHPHRARHRVVGAEDVTQPPVDPLAANKEANGSTKQGASEHATERKGSQVEGVENVTLTADEKANLRKGLRLACHSHRARHRVVGAEDVTQPPVNPLAANKEANGSTKQGASEHATERKGSQVEGVEDVTQPPVDPLAADEKANGSTEQGASEHSGERKGSQVEKVEDVTQPPADPLTADEANGSTEQGASEHSRERKGSQVEKVELMRDNTNLPQPPVDPLAADEEASGSTEQGASEHSGERKGSQVDKVEDAKRVAQLRGGFLSNAEAVDQGLLPGLCRKGAVRHRRTVEFIRMLFREELPRSRVSQAEAMLLRSVEVKRLPPRPRQIASADISTPDIPTAHQDLRKSQSVKNERRKSPKDVSDSFAGENSWAGGKTGVEGDSGALKEPQNVQQSTVVEERVMGPSGPGTILVSVEEVPGEEDPKPAKDSASPRLETSCHKGSGESGEPAFITTAGEHPQMTPSLSSKKSTKSSSGGATDCTCSQLTPKTSKKDADGASETSSTPLSSTQKDCNPPLADSLRSSTGPGRMPSPEIRPAPEAPIPIFGSAEVSFLTPKRVAKAWWETDEGQSQSTGRKRKSRHAGSRGSTSSWISLDTILRDGEL